MPKKIVDDVNDPVAKPGDPSITIRATDLFDSEPCSRCGGSGHYSYCQMYGTRCFKCAGGKTQVVRRHAIFFAEYRQAQKDQREPVYRDVAVGDKVANPFETYEREGKTYRTWLTVVGVKYEPGTAEKNCGSSKSGSDPIRYHGWVTLHFSDGRSERGHECYTIKRHSDFNAICRRLSDKARAHVRARYNALKDAALAATDGTPVATTEATAS